MLLAAAVFFIVRSPDNQTSACWWMKRGGSPGLRTLRHLSCMPSGRQTSWPVTNNLQDVCTKQCMVTWQSTIPARQPWEQQQQAVLPTRPSGLSMGTAGAQIASLRQSGLPIAQQVACRFNCGPIGSTIAPPFAWPTSARLWKGRETVGALPHPVKSAL